MAGLVILFAFLWCLFASQENGLNHFVEGVSSLSILPVWSFILASTHQWSASFWPTIFLIATNIYLLAVCLYFITFKQSHLSVRKLSSFIGGLNSLYLIILILVIFPLLFLKTQGVFPDSSDYLSSALDITLGHGYSGYRGELRGPIYPFLISIVFKFVDANVETGLVVPKLVGVLNFIVIYFIGKSLFSRSAGFIGTVLALCSYGIKI